MDARVKQIVESGDPGAVMCSAADSVEVLRLLNQNIFSSMFSSYGARRSAEWNARVVGTALELLSRGEVDRASSDMLLEIAYHGSLASLGAGRFHRNLGRIEIAMERLERAEPSRSSRYVSGLIAYARDDLVAAESAFRSLPDLLDSPMLAYQAGYPAFRSPAFWQELKVFRSALHLNFVQRSSPLSERSTVLLCSTDDVYLAAFGDEFAENALGVSGDTHLHLHLINNQIDPSSLAPDLMGHRRVSISTEHTDLPKPDWYAIIARFIILPLVMAEYERPILVTDIDLCVRSDPTALSTENAVTLDFSGSPAASYVPTTVVLGGHSLFQPTEAGFEFARGLSGYLQEVSKDPRGVWVADQIALLMMWRMLGKVVSVGNFRDFTGYDYGPSPERPLKKRRAVERFRLPSST